MGRRSQVLPAATDRVARRWISMDSREVVAEALMSWPTDGVVALLDLKTPPAQAIRHNRIKRSDPGYKAVACK